MKATLVAVGALSLAAAPFLGMASAQAAPAAHTVYVSTTAKAGARDAGCDTAGYSSIGSAVGAVTAGGTVVVCGGTYHEDVALTKSVSLEGRSHATIDASHQINAVKVTADDVKVTGFTLKNAVGEGILVQDADRATIVGNTVTSNDTGVLQNVPNTYPFCQPQGAMANDCGENIHLEDSSDSLVEGNTSTHGTGGILLSDETGPTSHNKIIGNNVNDNTTACGIVMAAHSPLGAPNGVPAPTKGGVFSNLISGNSISGNGLQGGGAGVQMAGPLPGSAVYNNTVTLNAINGNAHAGVTLHSHVPGQYMNGNVVTANQIGTNNSKGELDFPDQDTQTTGVFVGAVTPVSITVTGNVIGTDHYGIFTSGPVTAKGENANIFLGDTVKVSAHSGS